MSKKLNSVLCIDDEPNILELIKLCLETVGGLNVTCCSNAAEGIIKANEMRPDFILIDMMMPEMDGAMTLKELRKNTDFDNTPIVFMTARIQKAEVDEYLKLGVTAVLAKPFDPMKISDEVKTIWETFKA